MDKNDKFIENFKVLESITEKNHRLEFSDSYQCDERDRESRFSFMQMVTDLSRKGIAVYKHNYNYFKYCANVRNVCQHTEKINDNYLAIPNDLLIQFFGKNYI